MKQSLFRKGCLLICAVGMLACTPKKPPTAQESSALCQQDTDCVMPHADGSQHQGVCVEGTCQECATHEHCPQSEMCTEGQCAPPSEECSGDADCASGSICAAGRCRQLCEMVEDGVNPCAEGQVCAPQGFCVELALICNRNEDCDEEGVCEAGLCVFAPQQMSPVQDDLLEEDDLIEGEEAFGAELFGQQKKWTVAFGFDQSVLRDQDLPALQGVSQYLMKNSEHTVVIEGHADNRGAPDYNLTLSERRAGSVERYLQRSGIVSKRMRKVPYGSERPADNRDNEEAWGKNRRCEIVVQSVSESSAAGGEINSQAQQPLPDQEPLQPKADF